MELSIIVIAYNMAREIPRTLASLSRHYQTNCTDLDYEILVVDNGSQPELQLGDTSSVGAPVKLIRPAQPLSSPAQAINDAVAASEGRLICLMIDGAHLLTPGVIDLALATDRAFKNPVTGVRYFFLGPDEQNISITQGYCQQREDELLQEIDWPNDGYGLFNIGTPLRAGAQKITWFNRMFESNCLFMRRSLFDHIGGADEAFDLPGGGFLNLDLYKRACDSEGVTPVQLAGEGSFHQLHGGTTTNIPMEERMAKTQRYREQYREIRGHEELVTKKDVHYLGHLPTQGSKIHLKN